MTKMKYAPYTIDFKNKVALVTGASRGIGKQIALDLINAGAQVICTSTDLQQCTETVAQFGEHAHFLEVDFLNPDSFGAFLSQLDEYRRIDVCINNAGIIKHQQIDEVSLQDWDDIQTVNVKSPYFIMQKLLPKMKAMSYGRIVNIGSIWGHNSMSARSVYTASKYGLRGMTNALGVEFADCGILVNAVAPAFTLTSMAEDNYQQPQLDALAAKTPLGRLALPAEVSKAVLFLASDLNTYITGQSLIIDGGYTAV